MEFWKGRTTAVERAARPYSDGSNQFHSDIIAAHCMEVEAQFQYGFALGMLLMKDVYELPFPDKRMR